MNRSGAVSGFQIFRDRTRKWRCYHRKTRHPIDLSKAPIGSAAFFAEYDKIRRIVEASEADAPIRATLGDLVRHYLESDRFRNLAPRTRVDYRLCLGYLDGGRAQAMDVRDLDTPALSRIHDAVADKHGWRRANMLVSVLSQVYRQAIPAGLAESNPARDVIPKRRPRDLPPANRPWTPEERDAVLERAAPHMRVALALMMLTGLDPSDAVRLRRDDIQDGTIWTERGKTGVRVAIPVMPRLREALDAAPPHGAGTVLANRRGTSWTYAGLNTSWSDLRKALEGEGHVAPGLTLKGLRHTVATVLREAGLDERSIADVLGQKPAMALHYSKSANLLDKNRRTIDMLAKEIVKPPQIGVKPSEGRRSDL